MHYFKPFCNLNRIISALTLKSVKRVFALKNPDDTLIQSINRSVLHALYVLNGHSFADREGLEAHLLMFNLNVVVLMTYIILLFV